MSGKREKELRRFRRDFKLPENTKSEYVAAYMRVVEKVLAENQDLVARIQQQRWSWRQVVQFELGGVWLKLPTKPPRFPRRSSWWSSLKRSAGQRAVARAVGALDLLGDLVPPRINEEEIGDAIERIHQLAEAGRPKWRLYVKVAATFWWVSIHTVLHYAGRAAGIVKVAIGKGDDKD